MSFEPCWVATSSIVPLSVWVLPSLRMVSAVTAVSAACSRRVPARDGENVDYFTAPLVMPEMILRCMTTKVSSSGTLIKMT